LFNSYLLARRERNLVEAFNDNSDVSRPNSLLHESVRPAELDRQYVLSITPATRANIDIGHVDYASKLNDCSREVRSKRDRHETV